MGNVTYKDNLKKCSEIIHNLPSAKEIITFWVNHILKFGGAHLRPKSLDIPLYKLFMLDILFFIIFVVILLFVILFTLANAQSDYVKVVFLRRNRAENI